ncbi:UNVERIFIED_CONTAM: hypothetical protein HDU68_007257 [Siphonaria sp. JEL0065]|nr:hypothetical protein HDU68_007257 [Siphonaria sp. JEL0065]
MEAELTFHKELFSKLKFNFLEQTTKEQFLTRALAQPPQWCCPQEIAETERTIKDLKTHLKAYKKETEGARENLSALVDQVSNEHQQLLGGRDQANNLLQRIEPLNNEIAEILRSFDPEQKTLSELIAMNQELLEPVQSLQSRLEALESELTASQAAKLAAETELAHLLTAAQGFQVKVSEAKSAVHLRDPNLDGHLVWCQAWTAKLMDLEGIVSFDAVDTNKLEIVYDLSPTSENFGGNNARNGKYVLEMEINTVESIAGPKQVVDAKVLNVKCDIQDLVAMANRNQNYLYLNNGNVNNGEMKRINTASVPIADTIALIAQETRTRLDCLMRRRLEKEELESMGDLHMCWDDDAGLVEIGVVVAVQLQEGEGGASQQEERIVQVKIDGDYPRHWSCLEVICVEPEGVEGLSVYGIQKLIETQRIQTITGLIRALCPSLSL